jgi:membrane protein
LDAGDLLTLLSAFLPDVLMPATEKLLISTYAYTSTAVVSLSAVGVLWSASRGVYSLLTGLNAIYGVRENRGYFYTRAISAFYTFLFLVVLVLTLVLHVFGTALLNFLYRLPIPFLDALTEIVDLRFFLLLAIQTVLFTAMFAVLPNKRSRWMDAFPGAVLASGGWLLFSNLFSFYVEHISGYANIYGSVYAVALSMLWLYCCIFIIFLGGAFNRFLAWYRQEKKNK